MTEPDISPFAALGLGPRLLRALSLLGYEAPTPIQQRTIPALLAGRDVIGQAQTGTGKTAAFALPALERIDPEVRQTQVLVLTPTRELAMQVAEAFHSYARETEQITVLPVYGGAPIVHQIKRLERGMHVVVGTPGRLIDHLDRKSLRLDAVRMIVLDEADEMLKMGFIDDVERILRAVPAERQIALFSATMPPEILRIADRHLRNADRVEVEHHDVAAPAIEQRFINVSEGQKLDVLTKILELEESDATLVFRRTKTGAAELAERLVGRGFTAVAMHGDMKQSERENVIRRLRSGAIEIVVATDVAARGLDVEQISHVINYDIPYDVEAYVHRIGRTGRAGRAGMATLFLTPRERRMMREIERFTGTPIKPVRMPTVADVAARRLGQLKEAIRQMLSADDLDLYVDLVERIAEEGPHEITDVAAAAAKVAASARPIDARPEPPAPRAVAPAGPAARFESRRPPAGPQYEERTPARPSDAESAAPPAAAGPSRPPRDDGDEPRTRLSMAVGRRDGIRPADVVGSIANEAGIPGREIGPIEIGEETTFVTIPTRHVANVLSSVARAKFRGRPVNLRVADGAAPPRGADFARGPRAERPSFSRDRGPRDNRPSSSRDRGPRENRPSSSRDRFGEESGRPERGPRPPFAPRRDRDDRPSFSGRPGRDDRPSFSGRPKRDDRSAGPQRTERGAGLRPGAAPSGRPTRSTPAAFGRFAKPGSKPPKGRKR